jgi:hypothetical protein
LCGVGSHPGPGVSMAPGRNAAQIILADVGIDFKKIVGDYKNKIRGKLWRASLIFEEAGRCIGFHFANGVI